jgi:serine/threonine-protein kinase HipA
MTISKVDDDPQTAFVWIWLPSETKPVVAGRIDKIDGGHTFTYGQSYLTRKNAIPIYLPELPLQEGQLRLPRLESQGALRDAAPDAWGRRVVINRVLGLRGGAAAHVQLNELTFLLRSGSDRIGALDFQVSPKDYVKRNGESADLNMLLQAAALVEQGIPLTSDLAEALQHGTPIGGARPKALISEANVKYIAKFSSSSDTYNVVGGEFVAMRLAAEAGLSVSPVKIVQSLGKKVLLVERFDRFVGKDGEWGRRAMVSALTILDLDEMSARYASYQDFAEKVRHRFEKPDATLRELFSRLVFNILVGNTDDHARNHAAFWDGRELALTPAYDICPLVRVGEEASQAMIVYENDRRSALSTALATAPNFHLRDDDALAIMRQQIETIRSLWDKACAEASLSATDKASLWRRTVLSPFALRGLEHVLGDAIAGLND